VHLGGPRGTTGSFLNLLPFPPLQGEPGRGHFPFWGDCPLYFRGPPRDPFPFFRKNWPAPRGPPFQKGRRFKRRTTQLGKGRKKPVFGLGGGVLAGGFFFSCSHCFYLQGEGETPLVFFDAPLSFLARGNFLSHVGRISQGYPLSPRGLQAPSLVSAARDPRLRERSCLFNPNCPPLSRSCPPSPSFFFSFLGFFRPKFPFSLRQKTSFVCPPSGRISPGLGGAGVGGIVVFFLPGLLSVPSLGQYRLVFGKSPLFRRMGNPKPPADGGFFLFQLGLFFKPPLPRFWGLLYLYTFFPLALLPRNFFQGTGLVCLAALQELPGWGGAFSHAKQAPSFLGPGFRFFFGGGRVLDRRVPPGRLDRA